MSKGIHIDTVWTLRDLRHEPHQWTLYVNQMPLFNSKILRNTFYNSSRPELQLKDYDFLPQVQVLVNEVRSSLPPVGEIEGFQPVGDLWAVTHYPRGLWQEEKYDNAFDR
jgi:hypothetical protein